MKIYTKVHTNKEALKSHVAKIKKRGGTCKISGNTVTYSFPPKSDSGKKYDTKEKRLAMLRRSGRIMTFKNGPQIISDGLEEGARGVRLKGVYGTPSSWYKTIDEIMKAIDWKKMEAWHGDEVDRNY